jgi:peptidoglycan-associated lipoprotein
MFRKSVRGWAIVLCVGLSLGVGGWGCSKKAALKEDPSVLTGEASSPEQQKARADAERAAAQAEAERRAKEARENEAARLKEEQARKNAAQKEFEKSLIAKKTPGIDGQVFETRALKDIYFEYDRFDIDPQDVSILKENAAVLAKQPNVKIQVEGHCDERGTAEYNLALGERRANSARNFLLSLGIPKERISAISYGKEMPADPAHTEEAWAKNRRAHFIILSTK